MKNKNVLKNAGLIFFCLICCLPNAMANGATKIKDGTVSCFFEIASVRQPTKYEIIKIDDFSAMKKNELEIRSSLLDNRILFAYFPGYSTQTEVSHIVINMSYDKSNSGVELPIILNQNFVTAIGRQGSDLIGAFLNCTIKP